MLTKTCIVCDVEKNINQFLRDKRRRDGKSKVCIACLAASKGYTQEEYEDLMLSGRFNTYTYYYERHREQKDAYTKDWNKTHPESMKIRSAKYHKENPEIGKEAGARRRARLMGAEINDFTEEQWKLLKEAYSYRCAYCGKTPDKLDKDHIIPLSRNGNHTLSNIVPACHPCNLHKHDRTPSEADMSFALYVNIE